MRKRGKTLSDNAVSICPHGCGGKVCCLTTTSARASERRRWRWWPIPGSQVNGMFVLSRLATFLRGIETGRRRGLRLRDGW